MQSKFRQPLTIPYFPPFSLPLILPPLYTSLPPSSSSLSLFLTFAGASSDESRCFSQVVVDLHISPKHNQCFDQIHMVHLKKREAQ